MQVQFVDLDDDAVGGEGKGLAPRIPGIDVGDGLFDAVGALAVGRNRKPPAAGSFEGFDVGLEGQVFAEDVVEDAVEAAGAHLGRILQFQAA